MEELTKKQLQDKQRRERNKERNLNTELDPEQLIACNKCKCEVARKHYIKELGADKGCRGTCIDCEWTSRCISRLKYENNKSNKCKGLEISYEQYDELTRQPCNYCGGYTNEYFKRTGVDRIDSSKPYTIENCNPCCEMCNRMKLDYSIEDFLNHVAKIYKHTYLKIVDNFFKLL